MEEILASIRKIISEDDPPADAPAAASAAPAPAAEAPRAASSAPTLVAEGRRPKSALAVSAPPPQEEDVLELTDPVEPEPAAAHKSYEETVGDLDVFSASAAKDATSEPDDEPAFKAEPLMSPTASETTAGLFGSLARTVSMPKEGHSLEDVVRDILTPMMRDWLDRHLAAIVEARVQAEVERIARRNY